MTAGMRLLMAAFVLVSTASAKVVDHARDGFSINIPDGWQPIPAKVLAEYAGNITKLSGGKINETYQHGYQRDYDGEWLVHPYILIQVKETGRMPERHLAQMKPLRKSVQKGFDQAAEAVEGLGDMSLGEMVYDPTNRCLWLSFSGAIEKVGSFRGITCAHLTEKGTMLFHFYARDSEFAQLLPLFREAATSVKIHEGLRYVSRPEETRRFNFGGVGQSALRGALIGAGVGLVFWAVKRMSSKKKPPAAPPPLPPTFT